MKEEKKKKEPPFFVFLIFYRLPTYQKVLHLQNHLYPSSTSSNLISPILKQNQVLAMGNG